LAINSPIYLFILVAGLATFPIVSLLKKIAKRSIDDDSCRFNFYLRPAILKYFSWVIFIVTIHFLMTAASMPDKAMRQALFGLSIILLLIMGKK